MKTHLTNTPPHLFISLKGSALFQRALFGILPKSQTKTRAKQATKLSLKTLTYLALSAPLHAITWTGNAGDNQWTTANNWNTSTVPANNETVTINNGDTVNMPANNWTLPSGIIVNLTGNSHIGNTAAAARLYGGMTFNFAAGSGMSGAFIDLQNGTLNFSNGSTFTPNSIQHRGTTTYGLTLANTGFTTLTPGYLFQGVTEDWSDVTFNIDVSAYNTANGIVIDLIDYTGHQAAYDGPFTPTVNIIDGGTGLTGVLSFDTATSIVTLTVDPPGNDAPIADNQSLTVNSSTPLPLTLTASDIEGDPLTYTIVTAPTQGTLSGTPPNLTYTYTGSSFTADSFTFKANDGTDDSNIATVSLIPVPRTQEDFWASMYNKILTDPLNAATHTTWTEPHSDGSGNTITISRITYELGTLTGNQHTANPVIAAYYARPTTGTNFPGLLQNHGGGQFALSSIAKFWAEQGYASICINWGGLHLENRNPNEPASSGTLHPNTDWDGIAAGFTRPSTTTYPLDNPITDAIFWAGVDPATFSDGQTLYDIPHPINSSWILNGYAVRRAITYLQSLPEVDGSRIGVLGWSMGGRTTMMSSTDPRIKVLAPAVGGTGFLFEDFWGVPGSARNSNGWQDIPLFKATVADQAYWPHVSVPVMFLNGSNDFNAPFDLATKSLSIHETALPSVTPDNILVSDPHYNHRITDASLAARVHWMRHHLHGDIEFPEISDSELTMTTSTGNPLFKVYPDTSTSFPIANICIYYGTDRDSRTRFWREATAVNAGTHWEAELPLFDAEEMMAVHAVISYDVGFTQDVPFGSPTNLLNVASKVHTYYPTGVDTTGYTFPANLDTDVHQIHLHSAATLVANGLEENALIDPNIDDPSSARGFKDWYLINANNAAVWQYYTRKINDPSWRGGTGAQLTFDLTSTNANTLVVKIITDQWNENTTNTYYASVPITPGLNQISLSTSDFLLADNVTALSSWDSAKFLGLSSGQGFNLNTNSWAGSLPTLANLAWNGGVTTLDNNVTSTWLDSYGLPLSNEQTRQDTDGDGLTEWEEFIAGTDPTDAGSTFKTCLSSDGTNLTLTWTPVAGKTYDIEHSPDLGQNTPWQIHQANVPYTTGTDISITIPIGTNLKHFYRVTVR